MALVAKLVLHGVEKQEVRMNEFTQEAGIDDVESVGLELS
jgi:hypothetical protein